MIEQPQDEQPKIVTFERNEILLMMGVGLYAISMALPAVKLGDDVPGLMCFLCGFIFCFNVDPGDPFSNNAAIAALLGTIANVTVFFLLVFGFDKSKEISGVPWFFCVVAVVCVLGLLIVPLIGRRDGMVFVVEFYVGYYVWIAGLLLMSVGCVWRQLQVYRTAMTTAGKNDRPQSDN
ncbi:hypothetical protein [Planctomicrobium sp. SH527]|uniref:hypothetical protein n=1 Tax=Planctomicrobium sp. SH527 TaxID=3448123 RepID=UPI003F5CBABB